MAAYALDRGIYVGSVRYVMGYGFSPDYDFLQKRCRYLFITGISEIDAHDGRVDAPHARTDPAALETALKKPDNGYCRLFAH
jgi:hypothetical protein